MSFKSSETINFLKQVVPAVGMVAVLVWSYFNFVDFRPTVNAEPPKVKGLTTQDLRITHPHDLTVISESASSGKTELVYLTALTPSELKTFYTKTLLAGEWVLESESPDEGVYTAKYTGENEELFIVAAQNGENTAESVVSVQLTTAD